MVQLAHILGLHSFRLPALLSGFCKGFLVKNPFVARLLCSSMDASALSSPELQDFINREKQQAMVNEMIGKLTSACWDKCITGSPGSKLSSSETTCLTNCAQRYMDMSLLIMKRLHQ